jgi:hypothetical protein
MSIELNLSGYRSKVKAERSGLVYGIGLSPLRYLVPASNINVYALLNVKGEGTYLIPSLFKEADGRTCIATFVGSSEWAEKEYTLELWSDNSNSDRFWKAVLTTATFDVGARTPVSPAIPVEVSGSLKAKVDKDTFKGVTLVHDNLVAQCKGKFPARGGKSKEKLVADQSEGAVLNLVSTKVELGSFELQDHGNLKR